VITAILDASVVVQAVISSARAASSRTLDALHDGKFHLIFSPAILDEWLEVLTVGRIRDRHGMTDDELLEHLASLLVNATRHTGTSSVPAHLARDVTDTKYLALAVESSADFLVTNDRRHLLRLRRIGRTKIVTPAQFLRVLTSRSA
jgi:putative PIN family toxin of toxin-antitoxin system